MVVLNWEYAALVLAGPSTCFWFRRTDDPAVPGSCWPSGVSLLLFPLRGPPGCIFATFTQALNLRADAGVSPQRDGLWRQQWPWMTSRTFSGFDLAAKTTRRWAVRASAIALVLATGLPLYRHLFRMGRVNHAIRGREAARRFSGYQVESYKLGLS